MLARALERGASTLLLLTSLNCHALLAQTSSANFGTVNIASPSSPPLSVTFTLASSGSIDAPQVLTQGTPNLDFTDAGTGSCTTNGTAYDYSQGDTCTVNVIFTPRAAGPRYGAVVLQSSSGTPIATTYLQGTGSGPQVSFVPPTQSTLALSGVTNPYAMAVDAAGSIYIVNSGSVYTPNTLLKETWNGSGYTATTIGTGLYYPVAVAVDGAGNVFIADQDATQVVELTRSDGGYTQSIPFRYLGNIEGVAVDGTGNVYIASLAYGLLKESFTAGSYYESTIQSGPAASALAVDGYGNVYASNGSIFQLQTNGSYVRGTFPGGGLGVAVDGTGNVYTSNSIEGAVYKATLAGGAYTLSTLVTSASGINDVAVDASGNVYYCGDASGNVSKLDYADPPSLLFAPATVNSTSSDSPKTVTLVNSGNSSLNFTIPAMGVNPSVTPNFTFNTDSQSSCPQLSAGSSAYALPAGASCTLSLSYTPTTTTPVSGFLTLTDTALNAAAPNNAVQQIPLGVTGAQTTPSIDWVTPDEISYGTPLGGAQLNASSSVSGTFTYTPAPGTVLGAGTSTLSVTLTPANTAQYTPATATTTISVGPATPAISWPAPATITYGTALSPNQLDATSTVPGTISYTPAAGTVLTAGQHTLSVTLTPTDYTDYMSATLTTTITVAKATPVITWPNPQPITYGTALSTAQLNATGPIAGTFLYTPAAGSVPYAGRESLSVAFSPNDAADYLPANGSNSVLVNQAPLTVTAANSTRGYGAANPTFTVTVAGVVNNDTFATSASSTATPTSAVGTYAIVPSVSGVDLAEYDVAPVDGTLTITAATLAVVPSNATRLYGAANPTLGATVTGALNGDTFTVTASSTATPTSPVGSYPITYTVSGANIADYTVTQATGTLTVTPATPSVTWPNPAAITYGVALSAAQLNATASTSGNSVYSPPLGTVPLAGTQTLSVTFTPTDTTDFVSPPATTVNLAVNKAALALSANAASRVYGAANPAFAGTVTGAVDGDTFTESFSTTASTASEVGSYPIVPSVAGTRLANYVVTPANGALTISQAGTLTKFALSNSDLTLTATVQPLTSGTPTGTVSFYEGQTLVGTGTLANGVASYTATEAPAANIAITAQYSGDVNFTQSSSPTTVVLAFTPAQTSLTVPAAGSAEDALTVAAASGFTGTLTFSCSGLPADATCTFSPATYTLNGTSNSTSVTMTVQTGVSAQGASPELFGRGGLTALAGVFGLLTLGRWRRKLPMQWLLTVLLLGLISAGMMACGGSASTSQTSGNTSPAGTSTVLIMANGASGFAQTTTVTLTVQ